MRGMIIKLYLVGESNVPGGYLSSGDNGPVFFGYIVDGDHLLLVSILATMARYQL